MSIQLNLSSHSYSILDCREWIGTVSAWPPEFEYKDMATVGKNLSKRLRDSDGEYKCDIIIALTHARVPNVRFESHTIVPLMRSDSKPGYCAS